LIADRFNVVEGPLWRAPLAATFSCFTAAPQPAHAALTTFSVASAEDVRQAVEGFVAAFVELVEHNVLAAIAVRNSNLVELDPVERMSLDVALVVIKWRKEFSSECAAFVGPVIRIVLPFGSRAVRRECRCVRPSAVAVVVVAVGLEDRTCAALKPVDARL